MQWHQLDCMQTICTSLQTDNHINTSSLSVFESLDLVIIWLGNFYCHVETAWVMCAVRDALVQVKALLQEMANFEDAEPVNQYQSMYDMVKRRSNKEREKEDNLKAMESRAKSLNQIAQVPLVTLLHSCFHMLYLALCQSGFEHTYSKYRYCTAIFVFLLSSSF